MKTESSTYDKVAYKNILQYLVTPQETVRILEKKSFIEHFNVCVTLRSSIKKSLIITTRMGQM